MQVPADSFDGNGPDLSEPVLDVTAPTALRFCARTALSRWLVQADAEQAGGDPGPRLPPMNGRCAAAVTLPTVTPGGSPRCCSPSRSTTCPPSGDCRPVGTGRRHRLPGPGRQPGAAAGRRSAWIRLPGRPLLSPKRLCLFWLTVWDGEAGVASGSRPTGDCHSCLSCLRLAARISLDSAGAAWATAREITSAPTIWLNRVMACSRAFAGSSSVRSRRAAPLARRAATR
jgi:hypothetical protein